MASAATHKLNPKININALQNRVSPETEQVFNDAFWQVCVCVGGGQVCVSGGEGSQGPASMGGKVEWGPSHASCPWGDLELTVAELTPLQTSRPPPPTTIPPPSTF